MQDPQPTPPPAPKPAPQPGDRAVPRRDEPPAIPGDVPLTSIGVEKVGPVTPDTGVDDVLLGSIALVAAILLASLVVGGLVGALLVYVKHRLGIGGPESQRDAHVSLDIGKDDSRLRRE